MLMNPLVEGRAPIWKRQGLSAPNHTDQGAGQAHRVELLHPVQGHFCGRGDQRGRSLSFLFRPSTRLLHSSLLGPSSQANPCREFSLYDRGSLFHSNRLLLSVMTTRSPSMQSGTMTGTPDYHRLDVALNLAPEQARTEVSA